VTSLDAVRRVAAGDHFLAVLATTRRDGSVHASLVNAGVLDDPVTMERCVGAVCAGDALKLRLLRRSGRAAAVFRSGWAWAAVEGAVTLIGPDDPAPGFDAARLPQLLRDIFTAAGGTHNDWDEYDRVMKAERRTAVLIRPERVTGTG
jgi:PPOX class probable F420-dependent enzyme